MRLADTINFIKAYGTSEGVTKAWDTRGRGRKEPEGTPRAWPGGMQTQTFWQDDKGHYLPERIAVHDALIKKYEHRPAQQNPVVQLVAGGTASGKTTNANKVFAELRSPAIVNMDTPRSDLPEFPRVMGTDKAGLLQEEASDIRDAVLASALSHNNDIALDAVGSRGLATKLDGLEDAGYKVAVSYIHRPTEESIGMAAARASDPNTAPSDRRVMPPGVTVASHAKSRDSLQFLIKPGREIKIFDGTGKQKGEDYDLIYHRTADGVVKVYDVNKVKRMQSAEEPKIPDIF